MVSFTPGGPRHPTSCNRRFSKVSIIWKLGKTGFSKKISESRIGFIKWTVCGKPLSLGFPANPHQISLHKLYQQIIKSNYLKLVFMCADYKSEYIICFKSIYYHYLRITQLGVTALTWGVAHHCKPKINQGFLQLMSHILINVTAIIIIIINDIHFNYFK